MGNKSSGERVFADVIQVDGNWTTIAEGKTISLRKEPDGRFLSGSHFILLRSPEGPNTYFKVQKGSLNSCRKTYEKAEAFDAVSLTVQQFRRVLPLAMKQREPLPLHVLTECGFADSLASALEQKVADIDKKNEQGNTALHLAAGKPQSLTCLAVLLRYQPSFLRNNNGRTPMHTAALSGTPAAIYKIFNAAPQMLEVTDGEGATPLHIAVQFSDRTNTECLLKCRADVLRVHGKKQQTALHLAAVSKKEILEAVLQHPGVGVNALNPAGLTPLQYACQMERKIVQANPEVLQLLIDYRADLEVRDHTGLRPLHLAAENNAPVATATLLCSGATQEAYDSARRTPLRIAVEQEHSAVVRAICTIGNPYAIDLEHTGEDGQTLEEAASKSDPCSRWLLHVKYKQLEKENESLRQLLESVLKSDNDGVLQPSLTRAKSGARLQESEQQNSILQGQVESLRRSLDVLKTAHEEEKKQRTALEQQQENLTCCLCLDAQVNIAFAPCGHVCSCSACAQDCKTCPLCRKDITMHLRLYGHH